MGDEGLERNAAKGDSITTCKNGVSAGGAESGAVEPEIAPARGAGDADLAAVIGAWPSLPAEVRAEIVAMVKGSGAE